VTSLDRLPLTINRRRLLGSSAGAALAWQLGLYGDAVAQSGSSLTVLVLGSDARQNDENQRADIIMVSRLDQDEGTVRTLSIPRDLWVTIPGHGEAKINAAFQFGLAESGVDPNAGANLLRETIESSFGITIDAFAETDMMHFPAIVDAVGGIDVINPYELREPTDPSILFPEGPIHLDGEQALLYVRLRHQDGDGGRVMRQHLVLEALLARIQDPETIDSLPGLVVSLGRYVNTDISRREQLSLLPMATSLTASDLAFTNIDSQLTPGTGPGGAWIYEADWTTLPGYVQDWLDGAIDQG
jgi:LCP family protein required for cell wall assembly